MTTIALLGAGPPPAVNLGHLMGPQLPAMFGNLVPLLHAGTLAPIQILARR